MASIDERRARARGLGFAWERVDAVFRAAAMVGGNGFRRGRRPSCPTLLALAARIRAMLTEQPSQGRPSHDRPLTALDG
ncbi:MAG TPA: hypothetical protein VHZ31_00120 [Solirubrobacteraceae bacterium]|nr:hypothetical protein [Solirubrobacteraceae bacterium]